MLRPTDKINGLIPIIGFGTWEVLGKDCSNAVQSAIDMGYRHIDTAQMYNNKKDVGEGIKNSHVSREEIFLTTKIHTSNMDPGSIQRSTEESLKKLGTDFIDLLLIHWPVSGMDLEACLDAMLKLAEQKKVKYLGVSNFDPELFERALHHAPIINNQVKFTPYNKQLDNLDIAKKHQVSLTAYSPLDRGKAVHDKKIRDIADRYDKSAAQVILRWLLQIGNISVIPKAEKEKHRQDNLNIFDFELSKESMSDIYSLNHI